MSKYKNFDPAEFVNRVIKDMKLEESAPKILLVIKEAVTTRLANRIMGTVIDSFGKNELKMFEDLMNEHPELDEMDVLMMTAEKVDGLDKKLERNIDSLHDELVYDANQIDQIRANK